MMISGVFLASSLLVVLAPGPDAAMISQIMLRFGRRGPGLAAAGGMITAGVGHALLSVAGVSLLDRAPILFTALRIAGAATLLVWGLWSLWESLRPPAPPDAGSPEPPAHARSFLLGFLSTATNAKVGLFLIAFLPQFVPAGAPATPTMAVLAAVHLMIGATWLCVLVELAYRLRERLLARRMVDVLQRLTAVLFIALALRLALTI